MWKYLVWKWNSMIKTAKERKKQPKLRRNWAQDGEKKNYPLFDYNFVLVFFVLHRTIQYWLRFFPKKPIQLFINLCDSQTIHCKRDLDDSISCSYYKKEWWCWKFLWQQNVCQHFFISLIKIKPSISICSCTSDDSILFF